MRGAASRFAWGQPLLRYTPLQVQAAVPVVILRSSLLGLTNLMNREMPNKCIDSRIHDIFCASLKPGLSTDRFLPTAAANDSVKLQDHFGAMWLIVAFLLVNCFNTLSGMGPDRILEQTSTGISPACLIKPHEIHSLRSTPGLHLCQEPLH